MSRSARRSALCALAWLACIAPAAAAPPATIDLIQLLRRPEALPASFTPASLTPEEAEAILAAGSDAPIAPVLRDADEAVRIAAEGAQVTRAGRKLTVHAGETRVLFSDHQVAAGPQREGEGRRYTYAGRIGRNGYLRVAVEDDHDAPASRLIEPTGGRSIDIYDGNDTHLLSPDGERLLAVREPGPPAAFAVVRLGAGGPVVELLCSTPERRYSEPRQLRAVARRWGDATTAELALAPVNKDEGAVFALRLRRVGEKWIVAVSDPDRLAAAGGFRCR